MKLFTLKNFRILLLLLALAIVAVYSKQQRVESTQWLEPLEVALFPVNADGTTTVQNYLAGLADTDFEDIDRFFDREGRKYAVISKPPTRCRLGPRVSVPPPEPPAGEAGALSIMLWSLRLRYWAYRNTPDELPNKSRVRLFLLYHDSYPGRALAHSTGLQKGLIGIVHLFADEAQKHQNNVVIAHELLHTVGASDKYGRNGHPLFPAGYGEPQRQPRHPQTQAEIMAGRIALAPDQSEMAPHLRRALIGPATASEILWVRED